MVLTIKNTKQFAIFYLFCFLLYYAWAFYCNLLFSLTKPVYFLNKLDLSLNLILNTGLQHAIIHHKWVCILLDITYFFLPVILVFAYVNNKQIHKSFALFTAFFNVVYCLLFSTLSVISVEVYIAWMLVPLIFYSNTLKGFYFSIQSIRILFVIFFLSAALWKLFTGSVFNKEQFSAILIVQHCNYIVSSSTNYFSNFIMYLINNSGFSYIIFLAGFFIEFSFILALFTKKFDKFLGYIFILFLIVDYMLLGINYFYWLPFLGCLYFSKHSIDI